MTAVLAPRVLADASIVVAWGGDELAERLVELGARVVAWPAPAGSDAAADEAAIAAARALGARPDVVVADAGALFRAYGELPAIQRLDAVAGAAFVAVRAVAHERWIEPGEPGGRIVLIAPQPADGEHAVAAGAALENTARTLSVEWARFGVRVVALVPRPGASPQTLAELVAFLASPAGEYYSGCALRPGASS